MNVNHHTHRSLPLLLIPLFWLSTATASNWQWLTNSPLSSLSESDWKALSETLQSGLDSAEDGSILHWENPESGNEGQITIQDPASANQGCRRVVFNTNSVPKSHPSTLSFCKTTEGKWMIDSKPKPTQP